MRWKARSPLKPTLGDTRTVHRFLWRPLKLPREHPDCPLIEWRWLEFAYIKQERRRVTSLAPGVGVTVEVAIWVPIAWARVR